MNKDSITFSGIPSYCRNFMLAVVLLVNLLLPPVVFAQTVKPVEATGQVTNTPLAERSAPKLAEPLLRPVELKSYLLAPNDVIEVKVYQQADLETRARVAKGGSISMPLLGSVSVGGKSVEDAAATIRELLAKDYLVNPQVSVSVVEYGRRLFTILGEVQRPGTYEMPSERSLNILQAIAMSGGFTPLGDPGKVTVQRTLDGGEKKVLRLNTDAMAKDTKAQPFEVLPDDTITVGERIF